MEVHPAADIFPMLDREELEELAADIKVNGLIHPIVRDTQDRIVDGRNRYSACLIAGVEPRFVTLENDDAISHIISENIRRRHMTEGARAMAVVKLYKLYKYGQQTELAKDLNI